MPVSVEITVTIPDMTISSSVVRNTIEQAMKRKTGPQIKKLFDQTTVGWSRPPKFDPTYHNSTSEVSTRVSTRSSVYTYVNNGTPPHVIDARRGSVLRFKPGYIAATRPRALSSRKPSRFGAVIRTPSVMHPGIEARDFDVEIAERIYPDFVRDMEEAINLGIKVGMK